jgi:thiamine phosphate synthase YjbQ (UPF0047 family)
VVAITALQPLRVAQSVLLVAAVMHVLLAIAVMVALRVILVQHVTHVTAAHLVRRDMLVRVAAALPTVARSAHLLLSVTTSHAHILSIILTSRLARSA